MQNYVLFVSFRLALSSRDVKQMTRHMQKAARPAL